MNFILSQVDHIGRFVLIQINYTIRLFTVFYVSTRSTFINQAQGLRTVFSVVSAQIYFTGWQAMPLISVLAISCGGVVILQSASSLNILGGSQMIGHLMVAIVMRELAPLLTALVVIARSGSAVASEVGNMRANREIEALESMGIDPLSYIVFPRIFGGVISVLCLSVFFVLISVFGGFILTKWLHDIPFIFYIESLTRAMDVNDVWLFLLKNLFSGVVIFSVACYQGMLVRKSPTEVPVMTTQAVVKSIIYVMVFNLSVSTLFYVQLLTKMGVL